MWLGYRMLWDWDVGCCGVRFRMMQVDDAVASRNEPQHSDPWRFM